MKGHIKKSVAQLRERVHNLTSPLHSNTQRRKQPRGVTVNPLGSHPRDRSSTLLGATKLKKSPAIVLGFLHFRLKFLPKFDQTHPSPPVPFVQFPGQFHLPNFGQSLVTKFFDHKLTISPKSGKRDFDKNQVVRCI